jgi:hypothetical protein
MTRKGWFNRLFALTLSTILKDTQIIYCFWHRAVLFSSLYLKKMFLNISLFLVILDWFNILVCISIIFDI